MSKWWPLKGWKHVAFVIIVFLLMLLILYTWLGLDAFGLDMS